MYKIKNINTQNCHKKILRVQNTRIHLITFVMTIINFFNL